MDTPRPETASPTELIVRDQPTSLVPNDLSDDFNAKFELIREALRKEAQKRRKKKTPASEKIKRPIGDGKEVEAVQRPSYQRWLDENFPGWYVENAHFWKDSAQGYVMAGIWLVVGITLFNWVWRNGVKRYSAVGA